MKDNTISSTALTVLQGILYTSKREKFSHLVSDSMKDACVKVLSSTVDGKKRLKQLDSKLFTMAVPIIEKLMVPGLTLHYVLRKKYIEDYVRDAISRGFTQVVNLGAGFDTLAYRLSSEFSNVNFIEIDHPATQVHKKDVLMQKQINNLHLLSVDFAKQNLENELKNFTCFDAQKDTIFISEGVLMYLEENSVRDLFNSLKNLTSSKMEFIFTFIEPDSENRDSYGLLLGLYLKIKGEHLHWNIKKSELSKFVNSLGYSQKVIIDSDNFKEDYLPNIQATLHRGEVIAVAL